MLNCFSYLLWVHLDQLGASSTLSAVSWDYSHLVVELGWNNQDDSHRWPAVDVTRWLRAQLGLLSTASTHGLSMSLGLLT